MLGIAELIRRQSVNVGRSYRELEQAAADAGYKIRYQTLSELANGVPSGFPRHMDTVRALAACLDVSETEVVLAYARSLGLNVPVASELQSRLPAEVQQLDGESVDALVTMARLLVKKTANSASAAGERAPG